MISILERSSIKNQFSLLLVAGSLSFLFLVPCPTAKAQVKVTSALIKEDTTGIQSSAIDTLGVRAPNLLLTTDKHSKSGNLAMLFSAILPGAGQVYAHRYYTIPIIWGFGIYFSSQWINANNTYKDLQKRYTESVRLDTTSHTGDPQLQSLRNDWRNYRDQFAVYLILTYFLNIIDAYVGATLYDFNVSDDLGNAKIQFRIPLH